MVMSQKKAYGREQNSSFTTSLNVKMLTKGTMTIGAKIQYKIYYDDLISQDLIV
jgi:hypothetical protein